MRLVPDRMQESARERTPLPMGDIMKKLTGRLKNGITVLFLVVAAVFLVRTLKGNFAQIRTMEFQINIPVFIISMLIYFAYFASLASLWHYVTVLNRSSIPYSEAITAYAFSVLGKYIPGEVFMLIARFPAYEHRGVKARKVTVNFYLENLGTFLGAAFLFLISLFFFPNEIMMKYTKLIVALVMLLMIVIHPKIVNALLRFLERFIKGKDLQIPISYPQLLSVVALFICNWVLVGAGFYLLVCSIYPIPASQFLFAGGIFGLAVIIGMITFFAPSGLGVREGILALGLGMIMPEEYALIISLLARIWATAAELLFILIIYIIYQCRKRGRKKVKKAWWKEAVVYQIYPKSFCDSNGDGVGDIEGITGKLDYLKELGVDVIWLSPVYESPNVDNGYDISDYRKIQEEYGTMEQFDQMLAEIHKRGMKLVMDLVVNHTSDQHKWFVESRKSVDNPYRDYYIWRKGKKDEQSGEMAEPNNWISWFSGPAWEYDQATDMYYLHLFAKQQPDLNWENPAVRDEVFDMMDSWFQKGVDGFRMDVISLISKVPAMPDGKNGDFVPFVANGPKVHTYLREMRRRVLSKYDSFSVGETSCVTIEEAKKYANEDESELNMVFQFEHMGLDDGEHGKWSDRKISLMDLKRVLTQWQTELYGKAWNSLFWDNHDQPRIVSRLGEEGEYREMSAKMLATCLHMMQGTPYIYQGEELGMTCMNFTELSQLRDVESLNAYHDLVDSGIYTHEQMLSYISRRGRDSARTPMQWDDTENAGFTTGVPWLKVNPNYMEINAAEQMGREDSVYRYYQKLIRLRKEHEIIVYGRYYLIPDGGDEVYAYMRSYGDEKLLVLCNFTREEQHFSYPRELDGKKNELLTGNYADAPWQTSTEYTLRPYEAVVYRYHA